MCILVILQVMKYIVTKETGIIRLAMFLFSKKMEIKIFISKKFAVYVFARYIV